MLHCQRRIQDGPIGGGYRAVEMTDLTHVQHGFVLVVSGGIIVGGLGHMTFASFVLLHDQQGFVDLLQPPLQDVVANDKNLGTVGN